MNREIVEDEKVTMGFIDDSHLLTGRGVGGQERRNKRKKVEG